MGVSCPRSGTPTSRPSLGTSLSSALQAAPFLVQTCTRLSSKLAQLVRIAQVPKGALGPFVADYAGVPMARGLH